MSSLQKETLQRLQEVTEECREDMHEPDEQGITAVVSGYLFDNAMGDNPHYNSGELTIGIKKEGVITWFNLATLIALARKSKI